MTDIQALLGDEAEALLSYECKGIPKDDLTLPGPDIVDRVYKDTDRNPQVLRNLQQLFGSGRLADTGHVSILPVDQGIEHTGRGLVRAQPEVLRPEEHHRARPRGRLQRGRHDVRRARACRSRQYAHRIPFIAKLNHNELLLVPDHVRPDHVRLGRRGVEPRRRRRRRHDLLRLPTTRAAS